MSLTNAIMDLILMGLLIAALWFGVRLHKQLKALRAGQEDFARVVHELDTAAIRAHNSLKELRKDADESQDLLHGRILAARELMQKIDAQVTRAERVQRDLDNGISSAAAMATLTARPVTIRDAEPLDLPRETMMRHRPAAPVARGPFDRDIIREEAPAPQKVQNSLQNSLQNRPQTRLPKVSEGDSNETELLEKVHMSELVVANLNEMIRSLTLPTRQPVSIEDDLFGSDTSKK